MSRVTSDRLAQLMRVKSGVHLTRESAAELRELATEIHDHRATLARLAAWAEELRRSDADGRTGVGPFIAKELDNRIAGAKP